VGGKWRCDKEIEICLECGRLARCIRKWEEVWSAGGSPADVSGRAARTPAYRVQCRFLRRFWALIGEINKRHALTETRRKKATKFDQNMGIKKDRLKKCRSYYSKIKRTRKNKKYLIFSSL
jgi:hypothetical protein